MQNQISLKILFDTYCWLYTLLPSVTSGKTHRILKQMFSFLSKTRKIFFFFFRNSFYNYHLHYVTCWSWLRQWSAFSPYRKSSELKWIICRIFCGWWQQYLCPAVRGEVLIFISFASVSCHNKCQLAVQLPSTTCISSISPIIWISLGKRDRKLCTPKYSDISEGFVPSTVFNIQIQTEAADAGVKVAAGWWGWGCTHQAFSMDWHRLLPG